MRGFKPSRGVAALALLALATAPFSASFADDDELARLKDLLRSTTVALRAAQDDNAALTASQSQLTAEVASLKQQLSDTQTKANGSAGMQNQLLSAQTAAQQAQAQLAQTQTVLQKWQAAYKQAADAANTRGSAIRQDDQHLKQVATGFNRCVDRNTKLAEVATEILNKFTQESVGECLARGDPFTKLYQVKLENLAQDDQDRIDDLRIRPSAP